MKFLQNCCIFTRLHKLNFEASINKLIWVYVGHVRAKKTFSRSVKNISTIINFIRYKVKNKLHFIWIKLSGCRVGLVSPIGSKIDFKGDPIFESAAWFFISILKIIFTSIFEIKIHEKNSLTPKKFHFRWLQISRFFLIIFLLQV